MLATLRTANRRFVRFPLGRVTSRAVPAALACRTATCLNVPLKSSFVTPKRFYGK